MRISDWSSDVCSSDLPHAGQLKVDGHEMISSEAILSSWTRKKNRRSTGLPGKSPTRWQEMTVLPSISSSAIGSHVWDYRAAAPVFQAALAARPARVWPSSFTTQFSEHQRATAS